MARTSKTKLGDDGSQADRMMRAEAAGQANRQRAHEGVVAQANEGNRQAMQMGSNAASMYTAGEQIKLGKREADLRESGLNLEAAKAGFKKAGSNDRSKKLADEMDRGAAQQQGPPMPGNKEAGSAQPLDPESQNRLKDQASKGIEFDGQEWVPSDAAQAQQQVENKRNIYNDETDRIKAEAYRAQTAASLTKAQLQGNEDEVKRLRTNLMQPVKSNVAKFGRFMNGKQSEEDWASLSKMAKDVPEQSLQADIKAKQWTPRVQAFMNSTIAYDSLKFINATGDLPDGDLVDLSSPQMQQFTQATSQVAGYMKSMGPQFSQWMGIDSMGAKASFQNKMAASMVLSGMTQPGTYQPQGIMDGMTPSAGMPGQAGGAAPAPGRETPVDQGAAPGSFATPGMTDRAMQARAAGGNVPPTDSQEFLDTYDEPATPEQERRAGMAAGRQQSSGRGRARGL